MNQCNESCHTLFAEDSSKLLRESRDIIEVLSESLAFACLVQTVCEEFNLC